MNSFASLLIKFFGVVLAAVLPPSVMGIDTEKYEFVGFGVCRAGIIYDGGITFEPNYDFARYDIDAHDLDGCAAKCDDIDNDKLVGLNFNADSTDSRNGGLIPCYCYLEDDSTEICPQGADSCDLGGYAGFEGTGPIQGVQTGTSSDGSCYKNNYFTGSGSRSVKRGLLKAVGRYLRAQGDSVGSD
mmetsp:Transcript_1842/g.4045  ORF Transcript_1842/g.4045 Transcript_1842/m.4045 type:complete len:186 (-) Transcript_1842:92-649(-)